MHRITDVERLKKSVRQMAAGAVLSGDGADVCQSLAHVDGCRICLSAGYGTPDTNPQKSSRDRLVWILEGYVDVQGPNGEAFSLSQGDSTVLRGTAEYSLTFPNLTIYLSVEAEE